MPHNWLRLALGTAAVAVAVVLNVAAGLYFYVRATATPIHADAQTVPSVAAADGPPAWRDAVALGRQLARAGLVGQNLPGLSVAVGTGGDVVWAEGFGFANLDSKIPVRPEMRFRIAEVSIPLTSAAVGLLVEQEALDLDEDIRTYVPEFPEKKWPVTLRQLMSHTAGVRDDAGDEKPLAPCAETLEGLDQFAASALRFEPGTQFRESSYGWVLVSAAVEAAAKEPFFEFMRKRVFEPLRMAATRPDSSAGSIPDLVTFYFPRFGGETRYGPESTREGDHSCSAGGGGFLSTPSDLVRFAMGFDRGALLQPSTVRMLRTPQRLASGQPLDYALGWKIETVQAGGAPVRMASHGTKADFIGGAASLLTFPERDLVVAVAANESFADTRAIALSIAEVFLSGRPDGKRK